MNIKVLINILCMDHGPYGVVLHWLKEENQNDEQVKTGIENWVKKNKTNWISKPSVTHLGDYIYHNYEEDFTEYSSSVIKASDIQLTMTLKAHEIRA